MPSGVLLYGNEKAVINYGDIRGDFFGMDVTYCDVNGDGSPDIVAGARRADDGITLDTGKVFIIHGPSLARTFANEADVQIIGEDVGHNFGISIR